MVSRKETFKVEEENEKHVRGMGFRGVSEVPLHCRRNIGKDPRQTQNARGSMTIF